MNASEHYKAGRLQAAIDAAIGIPGAVTALPVTPQRLKAILDGRRGR